MNVIVRRLIRIVTAGLAGAVLVGTLSESALALAIGVLLLGLFIMVALRYYLIRPLPDEGRNDAAEESRP